MKLTDIKTLSKNKIEGFINATGLTTVEEVQSIPNGDRRLRARGIGPMFIQAIRNIKTNTYRERGYYWCRKRALQGWFVFFYDDDIMMFRDGSTPIPFRDIADINDRRALPNDEQLGYERAMEEMKNWATGKLKFNREGVI